MSDFGSFWGHFGVISGSARSTSDRGGRFETSRCQISGLRSRIWGQISGSGGQIGSSQDMRGSIWGHLGSSQGGSPERGRFGVIWGHLRGVKKGSIFGPLILRGPKWPISGGDRILSFGSGGQKGGIAFRGVLGFWGSEISSFGAKSDHKMLAFLR